jgi:hypothetical protein
MEVEFSEVQRTREGCSSTAPLSDKSAYPINPHTIPSTIPPAALKATSEANERGKPTMSSTPHHHGSTRARRVIAPSNTEPMSTSMTRGVDHA